MVVYDFVPLIRYTVCLKKNGTRINNYVFIIYIDKEIALLYQYFYRVLLLRTQNMKFQRHRN